MARRLVTALALLALHAPAAAGAEAPVKAGMYPSCPATYAGLPVAQIVSEANELRGRLQCHYGDTIDTSFRINAAWLGPESDAWKGSLMGCGRHTQTNWFLSDTHLAQIILTESLSAAGPRHDARVAFLLAFLSEVEKFAVPCTGPPRLPKFRFGIAVNRKAEPRYWNDPTGLGDGYRRTNAKGNGSFTTDAGGTSATGVRGGMVLIHRYRRGSRTLALRFRRAVSAGVVGVRKSISIRAVVTESEIPGCRRGDTLVVSLADRPGERDEISVGECGTQKGLFIRDRPVRGQTVDVRIASV